MSTQHIWILIMAIIGALGTIFMSYLIYRKKTVKNISIANEDFIAKKQQKGLHSWYNSFVWWILLFLLVLFALAFLVGSALLIAAAAGGAN